jgi:murein tripeptide amidase MpaA
MWRKNRQPHETSECWGRDLNRNWPYEWLGDGSSPDPCDDAYRGEAPGDAPETVVHLTFLEQLAKTNGIKIFIDFHSYSQYFMTRKFSHFF